MKTLNRAFTNLAQAALVAVAFTGLGAIVAPASQAQMTERYVGTGFALGENSAWTVDARQPIGKAPLSARGSLNLTFDNGVNGSIAGTFDVPLGNDQGLYVGAGVYLADESSLLLKAGWERAIGQDGVVYLGYDYLTGQSTGALKGGFGFSF